MHLRLIMFILTGACLLGMDQQLYSQKPNLIIFMTDDQSWDQFNFLPEGRDENGQAKNLTPNLDRLAKEGVVLTRFYSNSSVCTPARYNLLTGQYASRAPGVRPSRDGMLNVEWNSHITPQVHNLASELNKAGYQTAMVGKNHVIKASQKEEYHSFKRNQAITEKVCQQLVENQKKVINSIKACGFDYASHIYNSNIPKNAPKALESHNLEWILQGAQTFLKQKDHEQPYFLYFPITPPHGPHHGKAHQGNPLATPIGFLNSAPNNIPSRERIAAKVIDAGLDPKVTDFTYIDEVLGALIKGIKEREEENNTIIMIMTDHGVNHNSKGHLYDGGTRSPLLVWGPRLFKPNYNDQALAQMIDITPTVFDLIQHRAPPEMKIDGKSLLPLLKGVSDQVHQHVKLEIGLSRAIVTEQYKYLTVRETKNHQQLGLEGRKKILEKSISFHRNVEGREPHNTDPMAPFGHMGKTPGGTRATTKLMSLKACYFDQDQVFDLEKDPLESTNLYNIPEMNEMVDRLKQQFSAAINDSPGTYAEFKQNP